MKTKLSVVDRAYLRALRLSEIIRYERERAKTKFDDERYLRMRITDRGQKKEDALTAIADAFAELDELVNHLAILDMAAAYEKLAKAKIDSVKGDARSAIKKRVGKHKKWAENVVTDGPDGLAQIELLLGLAGDSLASAKAIRDNRNGFAHGIDLQTVPTITRENARDALNDLLNMI